MRKWHFGTVGEYRLNNWRSFQLFITGYKLSNESRKNIQSRSLSGFLIKSRNTLTHRIIYYLQVIIHKLVCR